MKHNIEPHLKVKNGHRAIREADSEHVRVLGMDIYTHDSAVSLTEVLRVGRVLQGVDTDHALLPAVLLVKIV